MHKLVDLFRRKVLRQHRWVLDGPAGKVSIRVDALPVEQFRYKREALADRLRQMHEAS